MRLEVCLLLLMCLSWPAAAQQLDRKPEGESDRQAEWQMDGQQAQDPNRPLQPVPAGDGNTASVYAYWADRVVQIQVVDLQSQSKSGIGSGFIAGQPGWVVSNYHVIAELANQPGQYEAKYLTEDGRSGRLQLLAVDVVHDLAVLLAEGLETQPLALSSAAPPKGTRLYSLGYPYDIGLTIVEGTYNGLLEKSLYEKLHFTGSINPGMSGGPALNPAGEVVGINVSTAGNQVSFLVPSGFVARLIADTTGQAPDQDALNAMITRQLQHNQQRISETLLASTEPVTTLDGYTVPGALADYINCWGNSQQDWRDDLSQVYYRCQTQDDIFLSGALYTGVIRYQHDLLSTENLHPLRFYRQLEQRSVYPQLRLDGDEQSVTNYQCQTGFLDESGLVFKSTFCVRRYLNFTGLYDSYLTLTSLNEQQAALQSTLVLAGFSWANTERLGTRFISSIRQGAK